MMIIQVSISEANNKFTICTVSMTGYDPSTVVTSAVLGGILGLSVTINIILIIVLVIKKGKRSQSPLTDREGEKGAMDIEMKPNSLYGLASGSESIVTKPKEVYGVSVPTE